MRAYFVLTPRCILSVLSTPFPGMLDNYQGQVAALFCADEVFCGREPHRGTETCTVVEAMYSLELAFTTFGGTHAALMDRVERLAFNALPAALTSDMWAHVYVQNANSVFAGRTHPSDDTDRDESRRHHKLHYAHISAAAGGDKNGDTNDSHSHNHAAHTAAKAGPQCASCTQKRALRTGGKDGKDGAEGTGGTSGGMVGDTPSGEDQSANFYVRTQRRPIILCVLEY